VQQRKRQTLASSTRIAAALVVILAACTVGDGGDHRTDRRRDPSTSSSTSTTTTAPPPPPPLAPVNVYARTGPNDMSPAVAGVPTRVYVPNSESDSIDVIDVATMEIVDHWSTGDLPQHVVPSWDLKTLYINNNRGNTLTPIDPVTGKPGPDIPVDDPYNLYFTPDGTKAAVMAEREQKIDFRNPTDWSLIKSVHISHRGVNHAEFSADGLTMFASTEFDGGWLVRIDLTTMEITGEVDLGGAAVDVKLAPDGKLVYVANQGRGGVSIVDPVTMTEVAFVMTGKGAHGMYPSRDATKLYVSNRLAGTVSVLDFATNQVLTTWEIGGSPDMGGVSPDGSQLWLSGRYNSAVYVIDTATGGLVKTFHVGSGPHGICFFPQPGRYSMGHTGNYR
jgi:YVTN family beta-propeller protein